MPTIPYVIVNPLTGSGSQPIDRKMGPGRYVAADKGSVQPLPITQAELTAMTALGLVKS